MCDLWQYTSTENTPVGAIPFQLKHAISSNPSLETTNQRRWLKLYNASNFFDTRSVPREDLGAIAKLCTPFERVIVENHPRFCDDRMEWFAKAIGGQLEVAMGLETIQPEAMAAMNKGMTLNDFETAVENCHRLGIDVRVFVLHHPPGLPAEDSSDWTLKTVAFALERKVRHVSIIPVRAGNGWIDNLIDSGRYELPTVSMVRKLFKAFPKRNWHCPTSSIIEFDLWDWDTIKGHCDHCRPILKQHIAQCNRTQIFLPFDEIKIDCECNL